MYNLTPNVQKSAAINNNFNQLLGAKLTKNSVTLLQKAVKEDRLPKDIFSFLKTVNTLTSDNDEKWLNQLHTSPETSKETLQMLKDVLGISSQKRNGIQEDSLSEANNDNDETLNSIDGLKESLSVLKEEISKSGLNEEQTLLQKNVKLNGLQGMVTHADGKARAEPAPLNTETQLPKKDIQKTVGIHSFLHVENLSKARDGIQLLSQSQSNPQAAPVGKSKISNEKGSEVQSKINMTTNPITTNAGNYATALSGIGQMQTAFPFDSMERFANHPGISEQNWSEVFERIKNTTTQALPANAEKKLKAIPKSLGRGKSQEQAALSSDNLEAIKSILEISAQKWPEMQRLNIPAVQTIPGDAGKHPQAVSQTGTSKDQKAAKTPDILEAIKNLVEISGYKGPEVEQNSQAAQTMPGDAGKHPQAVSQTGTSKDQKAAKTPDILDAIKNLMEISGYKGPEVEQSNPSAQTTPVTVGKNPQAVSQIGTSKDQKAAKTPDILDAIKNLVEISGYKGPEVEQNSPSAQTTPVTVGKNLQAVSQTGTSKDQKAAITPDILEAIKNLVEISGPKGPEVEQNSQAAQTIPGDAGKHPQAVSQTGTSKDQKAAKTPDILEAIKNLVEKSGYKGPEVEQNSQAAQTTPVTVGKNPQAVSQTGTSKDQKAAKTPDILEAIKNLVEISGYKGPEVEQNSPSAQTAPVIVGKNPQALSQTGTSKDQKAAKTPDILEAIKNLVEISGYKGPEVEQNSPAAQTTPVTAGKNLQAVAQLGRNQNQPPEVGTDILEAIKNVLGKGGQKIPEVLKQMYPPAAQAISANAGKNPQVVAQPGTSQVQASLSMASDKLETIKNLLGISEQKWPEVLQLINSASKQNESSTEGLSPAQMSNASRVDSKQPLSALNGNAGILLKAARIDDLLHSPTKNRNGNQNPTGAFEPESEQRRGNTPSNLSSSISQNSGKWFSKAGNIFNNQSSESHRDSPVNAKASFTNTQPILFQPMAKTQQLSIMLNTSSKPASMDEIQQQFETIVAKSGLAKTGGVQKLLIKLNPEHLGSLRIEMVQKDQTIVAKILTSSKSAKDILESNLSSLKDAFTAQNIHVDKLEITPSSQAQPQQEQYLKRDQQNQQGQQFEEPNQQSNQADDESTDDFTLSLEQALFNMKA